MPLPQARSRSRRAWSLALAVALLGCGPAARSAHVAPAPASDAAPDTPPATPPDAAAVDDRADRDRDGVPDATDLCPDQAMVMSAGCAPEQQRGCPDDCRPPRS